MDWQNLEHESQTMSPLGRALLIRGAIMAAEAAVMMFTPACGMGDSADNSSTSRMRQGEQGPRVPGGAKQSTTPESPFGQTPQSGDTVPPGSSGQPGLGHAPTGNTGAQPGTGMGTTGGH